jgi:hypothetical protein
VTVNGRTVSTDADGFYSTRSVRDDACNALDYLYEIVVRAPGYRDFIGRMYQSLVSGTRVRNVALELQAGATVRTPSGTVTPTPSPRPERTGDLGTIEIRGQVYDASVGPDAAIAGASVSYYSPEGSGTTSTGTQGEFSFQLFLHDTDTVRVSVEAAGFHSAEEYFDAIALWFERRPIEIGLEPLSKALDGNVSRARLHGAVRMDHSAPVACATT